MQETLTVTGPILQIKGRAIETFKKVNVWSEAFSKPYRLKFSLSAVDDSSEIDELKPHLYGARAVIKKGPYSGGYREVESIEFYPIH